MANTLTIATYQARTRIKLNRSSYDSTKLIQFADEANKEICNNRRWRFMEATFSGTITTNYNTYDLPTDFQAAINLTLTDPDLNAIFMRYVPYEIFDQMYPDPTALTAATPEIWSIFGTSMIIGPAKPDQDYTLRMRYIKNPRDITATSDYPNVPDDFAELLVLGMYRRALEASDNFNQAQVVYQEWADLMDQMDDRLMSRQYGEPTRMGNGRRKRGSNDPWA